MSTSDRLAGPEPRPGQLSRRADDPARTEASRSGPARPDPVAPRDNRTEASPGADGPSHAGDGGSRTVHLGVPATSESLRLVRLLASGVAAGAGLDIESVEDVRIAVDELANAVLSVATPASSLSLRFCVADELCVEGWVPCAEGAVVDLEPLAGQVVRAVATSHSILVDAGEVRFSVSFALAPNPSSGLS